MNEDKHLLTLNLKGNYCLINLQFAVFLIELYL